jgi:hypothetical protein
MRRAIVGAAAMLALALEPVPAFASAAAELPMARAEATLYGLPIFTTDGVEIGAAANAGTDEDGHTVLLAEIGMPLGIGTQTVAIPLELLALRGDRIDLSLTATEVRERLSSAARDAK